MIERPIFVGGAQRSGTTLVRAMLDRHPNIACGPELRVIPALAGFSTQTRGLVGSKLIQHYGVSSDTFDDIFAEMITSFLEPYRNFRDKPRIAEKTPSNILHFPELARFFPDARFIHVIRDGRDVVSSMLTMEWSDTNTGQPMESTRDPALAAASWAHHVSAGRAAEKSGLPLLALRYEDLIARPEETLKTLFEFLGEPWSEDALSFHEGEYVKAGIAEASAPQISQPLYGHAVGRWRHDLTIDAKDAVKKQAGDLLQELGYATNDRW